MARTPDPNSIRQRAFRFLDEVRHEKRDRIIARLMDEFDIDLPYASTLHASHRRQDKQKGILQTFYSVEEFKEGKRVKPYMRTTTGYKPTKMQRVTPQGAVGAWLTENEKRIAIVEKMLDK